MGGSCFLDISLTSLCQHSALFLEVFGQVDQKIGIKAIFIKLKRGKNSDVADVLRVQIQTGKWCETKIVDGHAGKEVSIGPIVNVAETFLQNFLNAVASQR